MPVYSYYCMKCQKQFDQYHPYMDHDDEDCPGCSTPSKRVDHFHEQNLRCVERPVTKLPLAKRRYGEDRPTVNHRKKWV